MKEKAPLDLSRLKTHPLKEGKRQVEAARFVRPTPPPGDLLAGIPDILAGAQLKALCRAVVEARRTGCEVVMAMGAHLIKCGLSLLVIDLMERRLVTALAFNGAGEVHDWEIAKLGVTSEDVWMGLKDGSFGMCPETAEALHGAADRAASENAGFGETLGREIERADVPFKSYSLLAAGYRLGIPVTVHVSLGCDIVHMHDGADGGSIGKASLRDFRRLAAVTARLENGVWLNVGSTVVLPEIFLKTLSMARNLEGKPRNFTTADLDMIRHYRPGENVVRRPGGQGIALTGHHEIMIPLLRWGILSEQMKRGTPS